MLYNHLLTKYTINCTNLHKFSIFTFYPDLRFFSDKINNPNLVFKNKVSSTKNNSCTDIPNHFSIHVHSQVYPYLFDQKHIISSFKISDNKSNSSLQTSPGYVILSLCTCNVNEISCLKITIKTLSISNYYHYRISIIRKHIHQSIYLTKQKYLIQFHHMHYMCTELMHTPGYCNYPLIYVPIINEYARAKPFDFVWQFIDNKFNDILKITPKVKILRPYVLCMKSNKSANIKYLAVSESISTSTSGKFNYKNSKCPILMLKIKCKCCNGQIIKPPITFQL